MSVNAFSVLQKIGKSLMMPVAVLPVAGLLLGIGSAHFSWIPTIVSQLMAQGGGARFAPPHGRTGPQGIFRPGCRPP